MTINQESFIELNRTFYQLSSDYTQSADTDDIDVREALRLGIGEAFGWDTLLKEYRIILLAEAGSGKTMEISQTALKLRSEGKHSFFMRLEHISNGLEEAFEEGNFEEFQKWLRSNDEGWLLLDSVDEARLRDPKDFERAIKEIARHLRPALQRSHIIITGRVNAWRAKTDLTLCNKHLEFKPPNEEKTSIANGEEELSAENKNPDSENKKSETKDKSDSAGFKVYSLADLSEGQIKIFLRRKGINDTSKFLEDIERHDAWAYTTRPQDLEEIIEFWNENKKFGTRLELMEHSVKRRLNERDQDRADTEPITVEKARHGAKLIAASSTFMHESTIRVPDGNNRTNGINAKSILADWTEKECLTLLGRPIFDEAIYGSVRFHHRSVREFLTAEWLLDLLKQEASRSRIESLFFREQYGIQVIAPSMKPILSWLVLFDEKIRKKVCDIEPEIIFEGGDPSRIPLETRREILKSVCDKMASNFSNRSVTDYAAVQRFANPDMADDIKVQISKHKDNQYVTDFLLRMIWQGRIRQALPEAKSFALNNQTEIYARIAAIRAVKEVGTKHDYDEVLQSFLSEDGLIDRRLIAELVEHLEASEGSVNWIFKVLDKTKDKEEYSDGGLSHALVKFAEHLEPIITTKLIKHIAKLLVQEPVIKRRYCEVSQRFGWLMNCGTKAVEKLIISHDDAALHSDSLSILSKIPIFKEYADYESRSLTTKITELVRDWPDLNYSLFWKYIEQTRKNHYFEKGKRLTNFWQAYMLRQYRNFEVNDFERIKNDITQRKLLDDRLVALSLAFQIYTENGRPSKWREQLKITVAGEEELEKRLNELLLPPPQSDQEKKWKRQEARWRRQDKERKLKCQKFHADWKKWLNENFEELRNTNLLSDLVKKGMVSSAQNYLLKRMRKLRDDSSHWTQGNWSDLTKEYGIEIASAFRDGLVSSWRIYKPTLRSENNDDSKTPIYVIFGLSGLEIESRETHNWPGDLSEEEVMLACRYAFLELNGFPNWFPKLHESFPNLVRSCVLKEIKWELITEEPEKDKYYIINKASWNSQWLWDDTAPELLKKLKKEPLNLQNLSHLLKIIQNSSSVTDQNIAKLASKKCKALNAPDHLAYWYAIWIGVEPRHAIDMFSRHLEEMKDKEAAKDLVMNVVVNLTGGRRNGLNTRENFKTPEFLQKLYLLTHEYIKIEEDINRAGTGVFSPVLRDDAQDARSGLFSILKDISGKESFLALVELSKAHPVESLRSWVMHNARKRAEMDAEMSAWTEEKFLEFNKSLESTPSNHRELFDLAVQRLLDLKYDLEEGDTSNASILVDVTEETKIRNFIAGWCRDRAAGRYGVSQEDELADAKKPDCRFISSLFDAPVPMELKLADNWSGLDLFERLENQLCGDYLRDEHSNRGIYLLVYRGEKRHWEIPNSKKRADFYQLLEALENRWKKISSKYPKIEKIEVIGIDLTKRSST